MSKIKYFKNFILCGDLNFRCLVCKENFSRLEHVDRHLRWEKHRMNLKTQNCMPKFRNDFIYKLDPYYYCSFCNCTMQDIVEIKQHIGSDMHKNYKNNPATISRVEVKMIDDEIFIKNVQIGHFQWHGIIDRHCVFCDVRVDALSNHMYNQEHIVRLIQARVNFVDDKYYRKIDKHSFQCFSCEKTFPIHKFDEHFSNHSNNNRIETPPPVHVIDGNMKVNQDKPRFDEDGNEVKDCTMTDPNENPIVLCGSGYSKIRQNEWSFNLIAGLKDDYFDININDEKLACKICKKDIKVIASEISTHLFSHGQYNTSISSVYNAINRYIESRYVQRCFDHGAARSKAAQFGKANFIKLNEGGSKGYCTLCDKFLSTHIDVFKGHTNGGIHQGHLELKGVVKQKKHERGIYKPVHITELIKTLVYLADQKAFLINGNLLMDEDSFFLIKRIEHGKYKKTKCFACDETLLREDEKEHCISWKHKSNLLTAKFISENRLPIREIRPKLYHCGVCNASLPYWETLTRHTQQLTHSMNYKKTLTEMAKKFSLTKAIVLKTNNDNLYMQLLNAVFNTKYVIKLEA